MLSNIHHVVPACQISSVF